MTVIELHNNPAKMAVFMGWPYKDELDVWQQIDRMQEEVNQLKASLYSNRRNGAMTKEEVTEKRYGDYAAGCIDDVPEQTHAQFVRECARESLGIKGRTVEEVLKMCITARPDIFCAPGGEIMTPASPAVCVPLVPVCLR